MFDSDVSFSGSKEAKANETNRIRTESTTLNESFFFKEEPQTLGRFFLIRISIKPALNFFVIEK